MEEELQWIQEVLTGNKQAYTHIINKYKNLLYATILRMTKNPQIAQDLVQESFIKVYHQLGKYDNKGSFSSWIYRVTINHCMDEFRKKSYQMKQVEIDEERVVDSIHPEVILLKKEKSRQLERLISTLPEDERMIILLRYVNELSYEEISELVEVPLSGVRNKLHRAKKKMRETVNREGGYFYELSEGR
ncbi:MULTISPECIES: RNA polymerase sigma factor [Bacillaceae]|uniref:RNA polymerase sigma factor n=1 Tax=Bacillaceae TaxID=186817 RepID=UPI0006AD9FB6|nr:MULTISPECIES: RNA polymerase sigma factor [Bacillaceae]ALC85455.1 RNA polymerase subunit sigma-70 [Bacillus sp. FJAT-22090]KQL36006.1 RNA polymerase subunit sigma-70 [Psychrobacillus sp. FJAT-21963]MDF2066824.1 RNA polymerase sigma factor [Bacillus sp. Cr_A10]